MHEAKATFRPKEKTFETQQMSENGYGGVIAKQRINPISYLGLIAGGSSRDESRFCEMMRDRFGSETHVIPLGRARSGIYLLVKSALRDGRRKVLLSPFTIPDVVTMVILAGGDPAFYDFEPDSTACDIGQLQSLIDNRTACVLITHHHVNEPRLTEIAQLCQANGAYLFDDCAITFGGSIDGRPLGVLTDGSVFSFSWFKLLNFFWGGMITTRNAEIARFIESAVKEWPRLSTLDYFVPAKRCAQFSIASSGLLFGTLVFPAFQRHARRSAALQSLENTRIESTSLDSSLTSRPCFAAFAEWNRKLPKIDGWLAGRRSVARVYLSRLGKRMVSSRTTQAVFDQSCFVNFPVIVPEGRRDEIFHMMMLSGFDVGRSLYPNVHRHPKFSSITGVSANVDRLARGSIYLPTHFAVSPEYAAAMAVRLADCVS
jgi:perosamine synthetase